MNTRSPNGLFLAFLISTSVGCTSSGFKEEPSQDSETSSSEETADACLVPTERSTTDVLFNDFAPVRHFEIEVAPEDWAWLEANARDESYVPATVTFESETFANAGIRYKGGFGSLYGCFNDQDEQICNKLSLKLKFNEYVEGGRLRGVRKLNFNSSERDPTYLRERISYALFREAGVIAPRAVHATLSVNGGPPGLYLMVEAIDKEFLEDHFDDAGGNLYKEVWPQHLQPEPYVGALKTNETAGDVTRMIAFADAVRNVGSPDDFNAAIEPWIDRGVMARYFVVDQLIHNWDGIWKFYCFNDRCGNHNFYIYDHLEQAGSQRFVVIPWDLDHTWGAPNPDLARSWFDVSAEACDIQPLGLPGFENAGIRAPQCDPLLRGLMHQNHDLYLDAFETMFRAGEAPPLSSEQVLLRLDRYRAQIYDAVQDDPKGPDLERWRRSVAVLRQVIREQSRVVEAFLDDP